jgi:serine/threonine protein kinase
MVTEAGTTLSGRYVLENLLDRGAVGDVWAARDGRSGARVAVKFLGQGWKATALATLETEAQALQRLRHPHVVEVLGHGAESDAPFIVTELLEGESLRSLMRRRQQLGLAEAIELVQQAADGLAAAHAAGVVHRGVNPSSLFVCESGATARLKVVDFCAAAADPADDGSAMSMRRAMGSPAYMSPEQAVGERGDHLADIWALSVIAFELLTGREPFAGGSTSETLRRICSGSVPGAASGAAGLPVAIDSVFARAFALARAERYPSAAKFAEALRGSCQEVIKRTSVAPPRPLLERRSVLPPSPRVETVIRHLEAEQCLAWYSNVEIVLSLAQPTYAFMQRIVAEFDGLSKRVGGNAGVLLIIKADANPPDEEARSYIKRELARSTMRAAAQVVEGKGFRGAAVRSALTMIQLAIRPPFPMKIFGEVSDGALWLVGELREKTGTAPDAGQLTKAALELRARFGP